MVNTSIAQERPLSSDSDTTFWFNWRTGLNKEIGIPAINKSSQKFEFRFWDGNKLIRLYERNQLFHSEVIFFLREYDNTRERNEGRLYQSGMILDDRSTMAIRHLIADLELLNLPSDKMIEGWYQGHDGITYILETSSPENYSFKTYWTPSSNKHIKEARIIQYFVNELSTLKPIQEGFKKFMNHQPFKSYYVRIGSIMVATVIE